MSLKLHPLAVRSGETLSYCVGIALVGFFVVQLAQGEVERQDAIAAFESQALLASVAATAEPVVQEPVVQEPEAAIDAATQFDVNGEPDMTLWAPGRIADYKKSLAGDLPPILGVLEVPSIDLEVPIYQTSSELVMDRAAGVINGMAYPHEGGNIGISGHRDGYFRALKDVQPGDQILLQTLDGEKRFIVETTTVVEKTDTHLLKDTREQAVTLVTCYPFYFVGHAPQRFIVTASLDTNYVNHK